MCDIYRLDGDQVELLVALGIDCQESLEGESFPARDFTYFTDPDRASAATAQARRPLGPGDNGDGPAGRGEVGVSRAAQRPSRQPCGRARLRRPLQPQRAAVRAPGGRRRAGTDRRPGDRQRVSARQVDDRRGAWPSSASRAWSSPRRWTCTRRSQPRPSACAPPWTCPTARSCSLAARVSCTACSASRATRSAATGMTASRPVEEWPFSKTCIEERRPAMFSSLDDPRLDERVRRQYAKCNETAGLVPLIAKDKVIGTVELLETRGERHFGDDEIATAKPSAVWRHWLSTTPSCTRTCRRRARRRRWST